MSYSAVITLALDLEQLVQDISTLSDGDQTDGLHEKLDQLFADAGGLGDPGMLCRCHQCQSELLLFDGLAARALIAAEEAARSIGLASSDTLLIDSLLLQAHALARLGDDDALERVCATGIALAEKVRATISAPYERAGFLRTRIALYDYGVEVALARGDVNLAIDRAELTKSRTPKVRKNATSQVYREQIRSIGKRIEDARRRGKNTTELEIDRRGLWDRFMRDCRDAMTTGGGTRKLAQAVLREGEAALYFHWIGHGKLLRFVLDRDNLAHDTVEVTDATREELATYLGRLSVAESGGFRNASDISRFADILWPTASDMQSILHSAQRLVIVPHKSLHHIPFAAVRLPDGFVVERWALRYAPSLDMFLEEVSAPATMSALAIGIVSYDAHGLRELPHAELEVAQTHTIYSAAGWESTVLPPDASEGQLTTSAADRRPSVLHLSCHGEGVAGDTPLESHLYLQQAKLDGLDIWAAGLSADTVVLSACSSGQRAISGRKMRDIPADDLLGLQAAFFASGARLMVAALFPTDDEFAEQIIVAFHRAFASGEPADIALAEAMRVFIVDNRDFEDVYVDYWAPFLIVGRGQFEPQRRMDR